MQNQNSLNEVLFRLREAEQILTVGVERGKLSAIERDIVLEKLRNSYELLIFEESQEIIERPQVQLVDHPSKRIKVENVPEIVPQRKEPEVKPVTSHIKKEVQSAHTEKQGKHKTSAEAKQEPIAPEMEHEEGFELDVQEFTAKTEGLTHKAEDELIPQRATSEVLGEKYQGKKKFRNETLSTSKKDFATKLQNKPIVDLTKSIGINEKFMFTKELFHGNAELYTRTLTKLNEFSDMNDALFYIQENFSWDDKNEAANQLIELVRRKLIPGY